MLSANIRDGAAPTSTDTGHTDTLTKPFELNRLLDKLAAHLKLEWEYAVPIKARPAVRAPKLRSLGAEHLRELVSLGQIGHVRGIESKLGELASLAANQPLVDALRQHVEVFDFEGYTELIERVSPEPD
ncbi:MAG: hypothetical protein MO852_03095 [Candidatus Devosia euplotis]|nr:hypothetical protein [Candidatus Devosia euplotis]